LHVGAPQTLFAHATSEFGRAHDLSHAPQFAESVLVSTQVPLQMVGLSAGHAMVHVPPPHSGMPAGQMFPQEPQLDVAVRSVSQYSVLEAEQWPNPVTHELGGITHLPFVHCTGAPGRTFG